MFAVPRRDLDVLGPIPLFLGLGLCWEALFFYSKVFMGIWVGCQWTVHIPCNFLAITVRTRYTAIYGRGSLLKRRMICSKSSFLYFVALSVPRKVVNFDFVDQMPIVTERLCSVMVCDRF